MLGLMFIFADMLMGAWGVKLLGAGILACFVTTIANIHDPKLKMLVFSMPIPFTCAYLVAGNPIDSTSMSGVVLVSLYHWVVYAMVIRLRLPLAVGIGTSVAGYIFMAWLVKDWMKQVPLIPAMLVVLALWFVLFKMYRGVQEEGHRTKSPWYVKLPLVFAIALGIYSLTGLLAGAVTTFPYAGVFTSYEMRRSLRTLAGQYMVNNLAFVALFAAIALAEHLQWPKPLPLVVGWVVVILVIWMIYALKWGAPKPVPEVKPQGA
jgi:hypothetical protein